MEHKEIGKLGEDIAAMYLIKHGYLIMARNKRFGHKEIDIIAQRGNRHYFIEVKTISQNQQLIKPEDQVSKKKICLLKAAIQEYCLILAIKEELVDLNVLAITLDFNKKMANIKHFLSII